MSKRGGEDWNNEGPRKRTRPLRKYTARIIIPADSGASVIGRGGGVIRPIRQAYNQCKIDVPDTDGPKRVIQVDSDNHDQLADCCTELTNAMIEVANRVLPNIQNGHGLCELLINGELHETVDAGLGFLSGFAPGVTLNFLPDVVEGSADRILQISGDMTSINKILKEIWKKFAECPNPSGDAETWFDPNPSGEFVKTKRGRSDGDNSPTPKEFRALVPTECTGKVIGARGAKIMELRDLYKCDAEMPDIQAPYKVLRLRPREDSWDNLFDCIKHALKHLSNANEDDLQLNQGDTGVKFLIHGSQAGPIIGKGGEEIEKVRKETGCNDLKVNSQNIPDTDDRIILAKGSGEVVFEAVKALLLRLAEIEPRGKWARVEDVSPKLSRDDRPGRGGGGAGGRGWNGSGWERPGMGGPPMGGNNFGMGGNFGGPPMGGNFGSPPNNGWNNQGNQWGAQNNQQPSGWQSNAPPQGQQPGGWGSQAQQPPQQQQGGWGQQNQGGNPGWNSTVGQSNSWSSQGQQKSGW